MKQPKTRWSARGHDRGITNLASKVVKQAVARDWGSTFAVFFPHIGSDLRAGTIIEIDHPAKSGRGMEVMQGPHAAQPTHKGIIDHLRKCGRKRCVKSVSTLLKDFGTYLGSTRLRTYDDPFHHDSLNRLIKT
jgi:hypothetical protein